MRVHIDHIKWLAKEIQEAVVTFSVQGAQFTAFSMDTNYKEGDEADLEVRIGLDGPPYEWEEMFGGNPDKRKCLIQKRPGAWEYDAYGQVTRIEPELTVDVGPFELEVGEITHDPRVVGEYVRVGILRLDINQMPRGS